MRVSVRLIFERPQSRGKRQDLGRFDCQPIDFKTGKYTALFKNKDAAQIGVSAEDKIRQNMKSTGRFGQAINRQVDTCAATGASP